MFRSLRKFLRRALRLLARPARQSRSDSDLVIESYRGFGSRREMYLLGRVCRQIGRSDAAEHGDLWNGLRRLLRRGAADRTVTASGLGASQQVRTDASGYFEVHLTLPQPAPAEPRWHSIELRLERDSEPPVISSSDVYVPPDEARFAVVSDIDDTVMYTGVANKLKMFWRLFATGAESRLAFPGVGAFYRGLHGDESNPILYVSRGPWSIYGMLDAFFARHRIPVGPLLFLRDWGVTLRRPLPRRAREHKLELIRRMLALYQALPFVLIGDSGQHDPENYARIVHEHPGRILAIYIRDVSHKPARSEEIQALAREVERAGSHMLLVRDSVAMAEHAADLALVPAAVVTEVAEARDRDAAA